MFTPEDVPCLYLRLGGRILHEAYAKIVLYHRHYKVYGRKLNIRSQKQVVLSEYMVKIVSGGGGVF